MEGEDSLIRLDKLPPAGSILLGQELFNRHASTCRVSTIPEAVGKA